MDGAVLASIDIAIRKASTFRNIYAEGDTVIVFFDASGTARDDLPYENTYAWFWTSATAR